MPVRLRDLLGLEIFVAAKARAATAPGELDRTVRWVAILSLSDLPDPIDETRTWLRGGELVVSRAVDLSEPLFGDVALWRSFMHELCAAQVAGLVVEPFPHRPVPPEALEEAERLGLPVIVLGEHMTSTEMTEVVLSAVVQDQYELLRKAERSGRAFSDLLLTGASAREIVETLASIVQKPVVLEDTVHRAVAHAAPGGVPSEVLDRWSDHAHADHDAEAGGPRGVVTRGSACLWTPVHLSGEPWGRLHVLGTAAELDEVDAVALDRAAAAVNLALMMDRRLHDPIAQMQRGIVSDILYGLVVGAEQTSARLRAAGVDFSRDRIVCLAFKPAAVEEGGPPSEVISLVLRDVGSELRRNMRDRNVSFVVADHAGTLYAILGVPRGRAVADEHAALGERALARLGQAAPSIRFAAGASEDVTVEELRRGLQDATRAAEYGAWTGLFGQLVHHKELGLYGILAAMADRPELTRLVETELGPLIRHDATRRSALLPTLRAYLETGASKTAMATRLGVDRRSVYTRLERLERVLNARLDDPEVVLRLGMAIKAHDFLSRKGAGDAPAAPPGPPAR